ncbi:hypothetical protein TSO221_15450 [Azospirillum sp. TSO22-1]|nr:hypothetical protein TSO221_15450 [Azospirillum sp. TSO22-1]
MFSVVVGIAGVAVAQQYNTVPAGDKQYARCISYSTSKYTGGEKASKIPGQTRAEAWCTCLWNETPDDFGGDLVKFSESGKGQATNKVCEVYSGWES